MKRKGGSSSSQPPKRSRSSRKQPRRRESPSPSQQSSPPPSEPPSQRSSLPRSSLPPPEPIEISEDDTPSKADVEDNIRYLLHYYTLLTFWLPEVHNQDDPKVLSPIPKTSG
ncbi:hypothetical protein EV361DRAFT_957167 [Lentinula raphanica]|nr:hypothetical protein EV361DRAFT_957167 [Lentinula raphanica]